MLKKGIHLVYHNSVSDLRSVNHWLVGTGEGIEGYAYVEKRDSPSLP